MSQNSNLLYKWNYEDLRDRSPLWYMIALSIAIGLIIWGFLNRQYGMSIVIMLATWFYYYLENNSDEHVSVEVSDLWIKVQWIFYDYAKIAGYSLVYQWDSAVFLRLMINKRGIWVLNVKVDNTIAANLRSILPNYIEENEKQEISFSEKIISLLKL